MSENAANEEAMGALHARVCEVLNAALEHREYRDPDTGEMVTLDPDPRIISSAITFLNNNKVVMSPFLNNKLSEIKEKLEARKANRFSVIKNRAREDALKEVNGGD